MDPDNQVLIEGVLFRARYLGSTQLATDGNPTKLTRMLQAQEAVARIKVNIYFCLVFILISKTRKNVQDLYKSKFLLKNLNKLNNLKNKT